MNQHPKPGDPCRVCKTGFLQARSREGYQPANRPGLPARPGGQAPTRQSAMHLHELVCGSCFLKFEPDKLTTLEDLILENFDKTNQAIVTPTCCPTCLEKVHHGSYQLSEPYPTKMHEDQSIEITQVIFCKFCLRVVRMIPKSMPAAQPAPVTRASATPIPPHRRPKQRF